MKHWKFHISSPQLQSEQDFRLLNSMSVINGLSTATDFRSFRKGKEVLMQSGINKMRINNSVPDITYGMPLRPATPIKALLSNFYGKIASDDLHNVYGKTVKPNSLRQTSTTGFELLNNSKLKSLAKSEANLFKMRKFAGVKPKTSCWRERRGDIKE